MIAEPAQWWTLWVSVISASSRPVSSSACSNSRRLVQHARVALVLASQRQHLVGISSP
jgi:hypothetical protein